MKPNKIAIIGAGAVGSTTAFSLILNDIAEEIMLIDIDNKRCEGQVLDLSDTIGFSVCSKIINASFEQAKKANIIVICAGKAQKPGESRVDLAKTNKKIITSIIEKLKPITANQTVLMVTNPVDAMTYFALKKAGVAQNRLFGTGTFIDTQRMKGEISKKLNVAHLSIETYVLGEHGDSQVPVWSNAKINDIPILDFPNIEKKDLELFAQQTKTKAYEIIERKGATYFGIAACVSKLCEAILFDRKLVVPVSAFVQEFGICLGTPAQIGADGIEKLIEPNLNEKEKQKFLLSIEKIKNTIKEA